MKNKILWSLFGALFLAIFLMVFRSPVLNYGGDIAEYHGITETVIKSQSLALTPVAEYNLRSYLPPSYFDNPGYYVKGNDGKRYPVHFFLYSFIAVPIRLLLHLFSINELQTLRITNIVILAITLFTIWKYFVTNPFKRMVLLASIFLSPLMFFISWPGPDVFYLCLLTIAVFAFFQKKYTLSGILVAVASLQSQPLAVLALLIGAYSIYNYILRSVKGNKSLTNHLEKVLTVGLIPGILALSLIYNLIYFGTWSIWTKLADGWTIINGFGLQNISLQKLFEQFFDLNFGLFFYAPLLLLAGFYFIGKFIKNRDVVFLSLAFLITSFFYQTNPAWHYGTAGYGPSRHAIFLLPLFIVFFVFLMQKSIKHYVLLSAFILIQIPILYMNGYVTPDITNSFKLSPMAQFVLDRWPSLYNPTPEIFVDRTNHTDTNYPTSAIYKSNGVCKKAYVLKTDTNLLINNCGSVAQKYKDILDDDFSRKSNVVRTLKTTEATFWPDSNSCTPEYEGPYKCMNTIDDFIKLTGVESKERITSLGNNVWKIEKGMPITISVPPGYIIQYNSIEGEYINF